MTPGLFPTLVIFLANTKLFQFQNPGIVLFVFLVVDITLSIFLENIRYGFFQKYSISERKFFSKNLLKFFYLVRNDEVFPLKEVWKHYGNEEQAAIKFWIMLNIEKSGGLIKILDIFDSYKRHVEQSYEKYKNLTEELEKIPQIKSIIENEYLNPTLTSGDGWVILSLLQEEAKSFVWEEYFLFYQSSYNTILSCLFAFVLNYIHPLLSYGVWSESKTWLELLRMCFYRPVAMAVLFMLFVFYCALLYKANFISNISKEEEKKQKEEKRKKECLRHYYMRVTIFCTMLAFFVFFFPVARMSIDNGIFWLINIIGLVLMLFSIRFANMWGLAVSRLSRKAFLYSLINTKKSKGKTL